LSEIRRVEEEDLQRLDAAYPEPGRPTSRHRERWALQERGQGVYLVAWRGEVPIGWVFVHRPGSSGASEHARRLDVAEIMDLWVADPFRGLGHGSSLLLAAEDVALDAGWGRLGLEVTVSNPHNDVARAIYERHGYTDAGFGEFESGYFYWTAAGERRWDGEPHRFLLKSLIGLEPERSGSARTSITGTVAEGSPSATAGKPDEGDER
jgi:GNAT superfamily N-acetyltransferase